LTEEQQHRRNQGSCVTNTYPEYEVGDVPTPHNGFVDVPDTNTCPERVKQAHSKDAQENNRQGESYLPGSAGLIQNGTSNVAGYICRGLVSRYQPFSNDGIVYHSLSL
jgi:hypothetical protein